MERATFAGVLGACAVALGASLFAQQAATDKTPPPAPSTLADAPGRDVVLRLCSDCHDPNARIATTRRSDDGWAQIMVEMQELGMEASREDIGVMLAYLRQHYGCTREQQSGPCESSAPESDRR